MKFEITVSIPDKDINRAVNYIIGDLQIDLPNLKFSKAEVKAYKDKIRAYLEKEFKRHAVFAAKLECEMILGDTPYDEILSDKEIRDLKARNEPEVKEKEVETTEVISVRVPKDMVNYYKKLYPV